VSETRDRALVQKLIRRGRPRQLDRAERSKRVIDAAELVFGESGYSAASMDVIARRAGMSKKTIYLLFENKQALFAALIDSRREALAAIMASEACEQCREPEEGLQRFLRQIARFVLAPRQAALVRLAVAESQRAPELANAFCEEGSAKACSGLVAWLAAQHERGVLHIPDPQAAAKMLFHMAIADLQMRLLLGAPCEAQDKEIDERVEQAVRLFVNGARPRLKTDSSK
jgi:TetR/AcrR family transcriptional regulator, mexJK operon transcriptional repressor